MFKMVIGLFFPKKNIPVYKPEVRVETRAEAKAAEQIWRGL